MAKEDWNVVKRKRGTEVFVGNGYREIFIGHSDEMTSHESHRTTVLIAHIIRKALNKDNPYERR